MIRFLLGALDDADRKQRLGSGYEAASGVAWCRSESPAKVVFWWFFGGFSMVFWWFFYGVLVVFGGFSRLFLVQKPSEGGFAFIEQKTPGKKPGKLTDFPCNLR